MYISDGLLMIPTLCFSDPWLCDFIAYKLRNNETLRKEEENALISFADKFVTCTLNPDMAAKMIDDTTSLSDGREIVKKAKETQTHHHTKTCKKHSPECRFGIPMFPMWKTMLTRPLKGDTAEEKSERRIKHKEVLKAVLDVLENGETMNEIVWNLALGI